MTDQEIVEALTDATRALEAGTMEIRRLQDLAEHYRNLYEITARERDSWMGTALAK
jgi:hypothetical protein